MLGILVAAAIVCAASMAAPAGATPGPVTIHVAANGDDAWSGRLPAPNGVKTDGPVATLGKALERARAARGAGREGYRVIVHGGTYYLPASLALGPEDSGTAAQPTRVEVAQGEKVRLVGGRLVTGWKSWRGPILQCDLKALGLGGVLFRELYCNSERQVLARYPNLDRDNPNTKGWLYTEAPAEKESRRTFRAYEGDLRPWQELSQAEIFQFHDVNYYNTVVGVKSVDVATRTVALVADTYGVIRGGGAERYFFQNLLEELDAPGEWYLDRKTSILYFYPPVPIEAARVEVPTIDHAVHIRPETEHVVVQGFTVEVARKTGVRVDGARRCLVARNVVRHVGVSTEIGGWAPWEDCCGIGVFGGEGNRVLGNDISWVGGHGVKLTGGDSKTLTPAGNTAENNHIHHTGMDWKQGCGARLEGVGNRFVRNECHHIPRMGVIFGGWDQVIEGNHLHHLNLETCDTGAIYTGGRDGVTPRGSVVRHNYIHDVIGFGRHGGKWISPHYSWGIYLDDLASGVDVIGNIVVGTVRGGVHVHNGRDNRIEGNILIGADQQQVEFNGWFTGHSFWDSRVEQIARNWEERKGLPAWRKYTGLFAQHPRDWVQMAGNQVVRNILVATEPGSGIYRHSRLPLELTTFDHNLLWAGGQPIKTGMGAAVAKALPGAKELCPNPGLEEGKPTEMPAGWGWYARPSKQNAGGGDETTAHSGKRSLKVTLAPPDDPKGQFTQAMVKTGDIAIEPGKSYRIAMWVRADREGIPVGLVAQSYRAGKHHWARETSARAGTEWKLVELGVKVPGPGDPDHIPTMTDFYIRIDFRAAEGACWVDDVSLTEAEPVDEWRAWQERGHDAHSIIADPLFVDAARGDYRLKPGSPALKLGFQPIPVEKIGCYQDPLRASWPLE